MQKLVDRATSSQIYLRKCDFLKENTSRIAKIAKISIEETTRLLGMIASTCRFPKNKVCGPEAAQESQPSPSEDWQWGEKKVFFLVLACRCLVEDLNLSTVTEGLQRGDEEAISFLRSTYPFKDANFLWFETLVELGPKMNGRAQWSREDEELLSTLPKEYEQSGNWKAVSYGLFTRSGGRVLRTPKMCRNKWENHTNPSLTKQKWSTEESLRLLDLIEQYGFKWAVVSRKMGNGRNQHMVKNHYNKLTHCTSGRRGSQMNAQNVERIREYLQGEKQQEQYLEGSGQQVKDSNGAHEQENSEVESGELEDIGKYLVPFNLPEFTEKSEVLSADTLLEISNEFNYGEVSGLRSFRDDWLELIQEEQQMHLFDSSS